MSASPSRLAYALCLAVAASLTPACSDDDRPGFGATVCLQLSHHGVTPTDALVYREGADDFPGYGPDMDARYTDRREMSRAGVACFEEVGVGTHWFAAEGFDATIRDSVRGSKRLEVTTRSTLYEEVMQVSEQH